MSQKWACLISIAKIINEKGVACLENVHKHLICNNIRYNTHMLLNEIYIIKVKKKKTNKLMYIYICI